MTMYRAADALWKHSTRIEQTLFMRTKKSHATADSIISRTYYDLTFNLTQLKLEAHNFN